MSFRFNIRCKENRILEATYPPLMVEQSQVGVGYDDAMLITGRNDASIIGGASRTGYVGDTALKETTIVENC